MPVTAAMMQCSLLPAGGFRQTVSAKTIMGQDGPVTTSECAGWKRAVREQDERKVAHGPCYRPDKQFEHYPSSRMRCSAKRRAASGSVAEFLHPRVIVRRGSSRMGRTPTPDSKPVSIIS